MKDEITVALAGNPNVGKSTLFNALTGMKQHTGNWAGKTVASAEGYCEIGGVSCRLVDIPGTYSLNAASEDEAVARDFIVSGGADAVVVICDATCLGRSLILACQVMKITKNVAVCVNLADEAEKKGIRIDAERLSEFLGVPVAAICARSGQGTKAFENAVLAAVQREENPCIPLDCDDNQLVLFAEKAACYAGAGECTCSYNRKIDKILTGKLTGIPIMLLLLTLIFYLTIKGMNYPSQLLFKYTFWLGDFFRDLLQGWGAPNTILAPIFDGVYRTLAWVVSVMLPPMAVFFPLFTLLEDLGYLPRVAFTLDRAFRQCGSCGKMALTMCMGLGCNAVGVTGCRIIDSPRERIIAILTNSFMPCNGRFPTMIVLISAFFAGGGILSALSLTAMLALAVAVTFGCSFVLSKLLKGRPSSFTLELPPFRRPKICSVLLRSVLDRTVYVLGRAVLVAAPAGLVIWMLANVKAGDETLLISLANILDGPGKLMGISGAILLSFILGFPANEIVLPIAIMILSQGGMLTETAGGEALAAQLRGFGWTEKTALCMLLFSMFHWPCSTTCLTIKKETGSIKLTLAAIFLPTAVGVILCVIVNLF